jgi:diadenosine tetraphosphate (Ap4A) HIT family hydrolase
MVHFYQYIAAMEETEVESDICPFCGFQKSKIIDSEELAVTVKDKSPVTPLHSLIIPKRHVSSYFDLDKSEVSACNKLLQRQKEIILKEDPDVTGFNIGINDGNTAGQIVMHCHIHLIPRRKGDMDDPRGGVRGVIPEMQKVTDQ